MHLTPEGHRDDVRSAQCRCRGHISNHFLLTLGLDMAGKHRPLDQRTHRNFSPKSGDFGLRLFLIFQSICGHRRLSKRQPAIIGWNLLMKMDRESAFFEHLYGAAQ
jgi:hypothetical protein